MKIGRHLLSLDQPVLVDHDEAYFGDFLEDHRKDELGGPADRQLLKSRLNDALRGLTYQEQQVIRLRYGLSGGGTHTLEEIGRTFRVTRERIRQIETSAAETAAAGRHAETGRLRGKRCLPPPQENRPANRDAS